MKPFNSITVYVEYRCDGGGGIPRDRLIRASVAETTTRQGGVCRALGDELIAPRKLTDHDMGSVHGVCITALHKLTDRIIFRYDPLLNLDPEEYPVTEVA
jgi:hypothetical protein